MDKPCGSQAGFGDEDADAEVSNILPLSEMTLDPDDDDQAQLGLELDMDENNGNDVDITSVEDVIAECEIRLKRYLKWQKLELKVAAIRGRTNLNSPIDNKTNVFIDFDKELMDYNHCDRAYREGRNEKTVDGSWLFLSMVNGGWNFSEIKKFFLNEFGVKCLKNMPERLAAEREQKAIVKFRSNEELNHVLLKLKERKLYDKFLFFSFDRIPITFYYSESDTDSEEEDARPELVLPVAKEA